MGRYIDADDVVKRYDELVNEVENGNGHYSTGDEAMESLKDLLDECPTADVRENVKGEWIELELQGLMGRRHTETRCGNCGFEVYRMTPFCPNCGADMRGEA